MKSILLIGLGRFGTHIAQKFFELGHEVLAVDSDENKINKILPYVTNAQIGDSTDEEFLRSLGIQNFDVCIVAIGSDFQSSLETTSLLKELGGKLVVARATRDVQEKFLLRNGADKVVYPEKQLGEWTAITYGSDRIFNYFKVDDKHSIFEVAIPQSWIGKSVIDVDVRRNFNLNILAFKENGQLSMAIGPDTLFEENKTLLVMGLDDDVNRCLKVK